MIYCMIGIITALLIIGVLWLESINLKLGKILTIITIMQDNQNK